MNLLLDLGNTRIKWMADAGDTPEPAVEAQLWADNIADVLVQAWQPLPRPRRVLAAAVVDAPREQAVAAAVLARFGLPVQWVRTPAHACGVSNAYAQPQNLGIDRFLAMITAFSARRAPCVVAGCGTALTLDALTADGQHLGGLIAPGPPLMQRAVIDASAKVQAGVPGTILDVATNTADALVSGCWQAAAALIERFTARMHDALGGTPNLLLSGGDAQSMLDLLDTPAELFAHGVLRGLAVWAAAHPDQPRT